MQIERNNGTAIEMHLDGYRAAARTESRTADVNVKLTPTQKNHLQAIAKAENIGCSTLGAMAIDFFLEWHPHREKMRRHSGVIETMLESLP